jgi:hypothetical protein
VAARAEGAVEHALDCFGVFGLLGDKRVGHEAPRLGARERGVNRGLVAEPAYCCPRAPGS